MENINSYINWMLYETRIVVLDGEMLRSIWVIIHRSTSVSMLLQKTVNRIKHFNVL